MKTRSMLAAITMTVVSAVSLLGCGSQAAPLPEVRYFAIADT